VVFEVLSQVNTRPRLARKRAFYEQHGVEEYCEYDPDRGQLRGWQRHDARLVPIPEMRGWVSPRLGVQFDLDGQDLALHRPDGERFRSYVELDAERAHARDQEAAAERRAAAADRRAAQADRRAEQAQLRAERLAAQLRALGLDPGAG
jgi:hypothetical protein